MRDSRGCVPSTHRGTQPQAESGGLAHLLWASIQSMAVLMT